MGNIAPGRTSSHQTVVVGLYLRRMRRAYYGGPISTWADLQASCRTVGVVDCIIAPSTGAIESSDWVRRSGVPLGVAGNRRSRFTARPHGLTVAFGLNLGEILDIEQGNDLSALVAVRPPSSLRPWVTAHDALHLGGEIFDPVVEPPPSVRALVDGLTRMAVANQGLVDRRERWEVIQALTYFRHRGIPLDPTQLASEAIRNGWPDRSPIELADLARNINAGKQLRYRERLSPEAIAEWADRT